MHPVHHEDDDREQGEKAGHTVVAHLDAEMFREEAAEQVAGDRAEARLHESEDALAFGDSVLVDVAADEEHAGHVADHVARSLQHLPDHDERNEA